MINNIGLDACNWCRPINHPMYISKLKTHLRTDDPDESNPLNNTSEFGILFSNIFSNIEMEPSSSLAKNMLDSGIH